MTDFEMLAMLMKKARGDIEDWMTYKDEEEIQVDMGADGGGFVFTFNAKTGMIKRGEW